MNHIVHVQQAERTEQQIINAARECLGKEDDAKWHLGALAAEWTDRWSRGRTDAAFAELIGCSLQTINFRRTVWSTFGDIFSTWRKLRWSHFKAALNWDDAEEWLAMADENGWSVDTMVRMRNLTGNTQEPDDGANEGTDEPHEAAPQDVADHSEPQEMERPVTDDRPAVRDHDVDRTKLAPEPSTVNAEAIKAARAMWRAARDLSVLNIAAVEAVAQRIKEEAREIGEISVPTDAVIRGMMQ